MTLKLTCLGGAAAWPNPGQGCSSFLVQSGATSVLLDAGADTLLELRKHIPYSTITAIVISHCHADHILDLIPYRYGLTYGAEQPQRPIPLWLPPGGIRTLEALAKTLDGQGEASDEFWNTVFDLREYDPNQCLQVGGVSVTFQRTVHAAECYAMRLETQEGSILAYTADTGSYEPLIAFASSSDILIAEATLPEGEGPDASAGHLMPSQAGKLARLAGVHRLLLSHLWAERAEVEVISAAGAEYTGEIQTARPGLVLDV